MLYNQSMTPAQGFMRLGQYLYEPIAICLQFFEKLVRRWQCMKTEVGHTKNMLRMNNLRLYSNSWRSRAMDVVYPEMVL